jgi:LysR family transcriptional regulator, transcriptional activator of nhaA
MATMRRFNYQHLLYFWAVVRTGSLRRACEELSLSAPTISAQLRTLEHRLGEKLLEKSGRTLVPTEIGKLVFGYADEIFGLGRELLDALENRPSRRPLRLVVGIDDVVPKETAHRLIEPALRMDHEVRLVCREGTLERLTADLAVHEIDMVLSDAALSPSLNVRAYSHHLGESAITWMSMPRIAAALRKGFPRTLDGVPMLLPTSDTAIRRAIDQWLARLGIHALIVGEFEDYGLLREFAHAGHGLIPVPALQVEYFRELYGLVPIGTAEGISVQFYALSIEKKIKHPAVAAIVQNARQIFLDQAATQPRPRRSGARRRRYRGARLRAD